MNPDLPPKERRFSLPSEVRQVSGDSDKLQPKDWPHAPVHRLNENGVYFLTAGTIYKQRFFDSPHKLDLLERMLLSEAKSSGWQLEAWAVLSNHYHFVARGNQESVPLGEVLRS